VPDSIMQPGDVTVMQFSVIEPWVIHRVIAKGVHKLIGSYTSKSTALRIACELIDGHRVWLYGDGQTRTFAEYPCTSAADAA
jgi:hypothetical protein